MSFLLDLTRDLGLPRNLEVLPSPLPLSLDAAPSTDFRLDPSYARFHILNTAMSSFAGTRCREEGLPVHGTECTQ